MPTYTLKYFDVRAAAEISRLLFAVAGVKYNDVRYSREEWPKHKEEMPMKAMPVLEIDGEKFCQSNAIARFLAREFGLYGKTNRDALRIDEVYEAVVETVQALVKMRFAKDEEKPALLKTFVEETMPKFLCFIDLRLCSNKKGEGYIVGDTLTVGDLVLYNGLFFVFKLIGKDEMEKLMTKHEKIRAFWKRIDAVPKVAEWVKKRPETEF